MLAWNEHSHQSVIICLESSKLNLNRIKLPGSGLQLLTVEFVGASELATGIQVQTCMKYSAAVRVNVTLVCLSV